jgi:hypothetical protein
VFNEGHHQRDFTYIDDIVQGVVAAVDQGRAPDPCVEFGCARPETSYAPYRIYNIGNQRPVTLLRYIEVLEQCLGRKAQKNLVPMQQGDVPDTWADVGYSRALATRLPRVTGILPTPSTFWIARLILAASEDRSRSRRKRDIRRAWYLSQDRGIPRRRAGPASFRRKDSEAKQIAQCPAEGSVVISKPGRNSYIAGAT